jgi:hypothetical protein
LMRHAKLSTTLEVYTHAGMDKKRLAQKRAVDLLLDRNPRMDSLKARERGSVPLMFPREQCCSQNLSVDC